VSASRGRLIGACVGIICGSATLAWAQNAALDGRALFTDERKGNCAACHKTSADALRKGAVNIGPALESIKQKYPAPADRTRLRDAIWNMSKTKPDTIMPPYGKHHILTEAELDAIVAYLETL
jgi:L-cysteine S-thiosulfotransferase